MPSSMESHGNRSPQPAGQVPRLRFGRRGVGDRRLVPRFGAARGDEELLRRLSGRRSAKPPRPGWKAIASTNKVGPVQVTGL